MAMGVTSLGVVRDDAECCVKVRILKLWFGLSSLVADTITSIDFVMLDAQGFRMLGSVPAEFIDRYLGLIAEGHTYLMCDVLVLPSLNGVFAGRVANTITLSSNSLVLPSPSPVIGDLGLDLISSVDVLSHRFGYRGLVDVLGVVASVRYEDTLSARGCFGIVLRISLVDDRGKFDCYLSGRLVHEFQWLFREGYPRLPSLLMQFVKIDSENGAVVVNGVENVTRLLLNPDVLDVHRLRRRLEAQGVAKSLRRRVSGPCSIFPPRFRFARIYPPRGLVNVQQCVKDGPFVVCARVSGLTLIDTKEYAICSCCRELVLQHGRFFCSFCRVYSFGVVPRLKLALEVTDGVSTVKFRMFDNLLGGFQALNHDVLGTSYALSCHGLNILKSGWVLLIIRKEAVDVPHLLFQVVALTDGVEAIRRFRRDHPFFVPAALVLALDDPSDTLGGLTLSLDDFAAVGGVV